MTGQTEQILATFAGLLALVAAGIVLVLHVVPSGVDPMTDGVSAYALTSLGFLYKSQVVATGSAALLLTVVLLSRGLTSGIGLSLLAAFGGSRIVIARFPTDPRGTTIFSRAGRLHILLAAVAFVTIAIAAPMIGATLTGDLGWAGSTTLATLLGWAVSVFVVGTFASATRPLTRRIFGVVERGVYASMLPWLVVVAVGVVVAPS